MAFFPVRQLFFELGDAPRFRLELAFATRPDGACVHLGTRDNPNDCSIYAIRGTTCREFEAGSDACTRVRQRHGLAALG